MEDSAANGQAANFSYYSNAGDQRLEQITNLNPDTSQLSQSSYVYDAKGRITQWTQQSGTSDPLQYTYGYDAADQLTGASQADTVSSAVTKQFYYGYDAAGNRTGEQINAGVKQATVNNLNQVTAQNGGGPVRFQGTLSEAATVTVSGTPAQMTSGTSFVANPVLSSGTNSVTVEATDGSGNTQSNTYQVVVPSGTSQTLTYDANGSMTANGYGQTYKWDAEKRLTEIDYSSGSITKTLFTYDALGRRSQIVEMNGGTVVSTKNLLWFPGAAQPCEERDASDNVTKRYYGQGEQMIVSGTANNYYYTRDHLGSVREMTDDSGTLQARYDYSPYGYTTKLSGGLDSDFTYAGYYNHATSGLNLTLFRAYNPYLGRWISRDPIGEDGGINLYGYVGNSPVNEVDPWGLAGIFMAGHPHGLNTGPWNSTDTKIMIGIAGVGTAPIAAGEEGIGGMILWIGYVLNGLMSHDKPCPPLGAAKVSPNFKPPTNPPQPPPTDIPPGWRVRIMPPAPNYPNGYWRLEKPMSNGGWQGIDPSTMKPGTQPQTHVELPPESAPPSAPTIQPPPEPPIEIIPIE